MKYILGLIVVLVMLGCDGKVDISPKEVKWDREECERCAMMLGDPDFAAQIVSIDDGSTYFFDDIGCAFLWLNNTGNPLDLEDVKIYVRNIENKNFIDAREALFTTDRISPMSYNYLAHDPKVFDKAGGKYVTFNTIYNAILR